jgi:DNA-binding NarL/FixJ family response regulator
MEEHGYQAMATTRDVSGTVGRAATRVLIAAATTLYRDGVLAALQDDDRFLVVGSAQDAREFVWRVIAERPDIALLDVELLRAAAAQGLLPAAEDGPRLVVLAVGDREEDLSACVDAGATEIVRRRADRDELLATIDRALGGDSRLSSLRQSLLCDPSAAPVNGGASSLTPREREILRLIEMGWTNKSIALELGCSLSTVKNHVHAILVKLGVNRRTEAALVARELLAVGDASGS